MKHGYIEYERKLKKTVKKMKKEHPTLIEKLKIVYKKSRDLTKIPEKISKVILKGDEIQTFYDQTKDLLRPLEQLNVNEVIKQFEVHTKIFFINLSQNSTTILINIMHCSISVR